MVVRFVRALAVVIMLLCLGYTQANAEGQTSDKKNNIEENSAVQESINKDMEMINKLMLQNQPPREPDPVVKDVEFDIGENFVMGNNTARLIIVQFSDYTCSHCAFYTKEILPDIEKNYIDTGKVQYVIIDYPFQGNIPAVTAAEAAHCAADQGKFREMHEEIMFEQTKIEDINGIASSVNLDMTDFRVCMEIKKYADTVIKNVTLADKLGIPSVPGFIIGKIDPHNPKKVTGISYIRGAKTYTIFKEAIEKALADLSR